MAGGFGRRSKKGETKTEPEQAATVVDEQAAKARTIADERLEGPVGPSAGVAEQGPGETDGEALPGGLSWEQVNKAEEQFADAIGQTRSEGEGLEGLMGVDDVAAAKAGRYDWFTAPAEDTGPPDDPHDRSFDNPFFPGAGAGGGSDEAVGAGGGSSKPGAEGGAEVTGGSGAAQDAGIFDLLGSADSDPLTSFVQGVEAKLGRDSGLSTPSDQKDASPADGKPSVSDYPNDKWDVATAVRNAEGRKADIPLTVEPPMGPDPAPKAGEDGFIGPLDYWDQRAKENEDETTQAATQVKDPGPDGGESMPVPEEFNDALNDTMARYRASRPAYGDGVTDPVEIEGEAGGAAGAAAALPAYVERGHAMFGQPADETSIGGGAPAQNPGADSQGAGVITPGDDQTVDTGRRDDDPFDAVQQAPKPPPDSGDSGTESDGGGGASYLPSEIVGPAETPYDEVDDFDPS